VSAGRDDRLSPRDGRSRGAVLAREGLRYAVALLGYVAIGLLTKGYLSFTWGLLYFVTMLEVVPRLVRRIRDRGDEPAQPAADVVIEL
jgi:hypothetical protein